MSKILVTGGAGFIGSSLCEELITDKDNDIYSLDNYSTGSVENHIKGVNYINGSTSNISELITIKPDIVYHLGEYSRVEQSFEDIERVWKSNKEGTFAVLQYCRANNSKLVYSGSSTKFGDGGLGRNQSPYAWTKASNTELVVNYGNWFNLSFAIVYFYNVYGKREISSGKYATLIALFYKKIKQNQKLTVVKPGTQMRNFTHIEDIIKGLILVGEKGYGDDFGIGCQDSYSILDVANMFSGTIEMLPERKGNRMAADINTTRMEALGWKANNKLKDYIRDLIKD
jgi:UDP-glucose 4-epimerase